MVDDRIVYDSSPRVEGSLLNGFWFSDTVRNNYCNNYRIVDGGFTRQLVITLGTTWSAGYG